ncbi:hypothetical protein [Brevundimonas subvibrioides]|uniref:hypothetical protein n=1 Tax=Brevundimonas subvibrioides TaxID=74313 RepID=UPI0022B439B1|nr:hypothetical protein [Brevundimonas subvibrioides]
MPRILIPGLVRQGDLRFCVASVVANITEDTANMIAAILAESSDRHTVKNSTPKPAKIPPSVQPSPRDIVRLRIGPIP